MQAEALSLEEVPASQSEQFDDPDKEYSPGRQLKQEADPGFEKVPAGQVRQLFVSGLEYFPASQGPHPAEPAIDEYPLPQASQLRIEILPLLLFAVPTGQFMHEVCKPGVSEYVPIGHAKQLLLVANINVPAGQVIEQEVEPTVE